MKKAKTIKTYSINIDMKWSQEYIIKAKSKADAKKKAWLRFKKRCPKGLFELLVDKID